MGEGILKLLNDNEKEVLELLFNGYDAKTSAYKLDVTPNVINERLRSSRRKLGVTSSKEAARLLAETNQIKHKFLGPKEIGIEKPPKNNAIHPLPEQQAAVADDNRVRETQATYQSFGDLQGSIPSTKYSLPFRKQGELGNDLSKQERIAAIGDLTVKLAVTFAFVCLAAILLSTLISRA